MSVSVTGNVIRGPSS
ncbi:MAG: hypothetical protein HQL07_17185 [Nitrospirae bacterium]|nr:hypothetical protein [Magnetococcales bacterium]HAT48984.1 hypothetical protein [Alphaproteobacteria bacterium]